MFSEMSKPTFMVAALIGGLALFVAGFIIALEVRSTVASPAAATTGGACYTNWNGNTCAAGYTPVETGVWTTVLYGETGTVQAGTLICAEEKYQQGGSDASIFADVTDADGSGNHDVQREPCAICCASGGVVGGIGELPDVAGTGDPLPRNPIIIAAVTGAIAFGAGAWYARRRWSR